MDHALAAHFFYSSWYIDDVLVFARSLTELRRSTESVKSDLTCHGAVINEEKSEYEKQFLLFAGLWITPFSTGSNLAKVREFAELPAPSTEVERRSALGLASYLRDFVPFCSILTSGIEKSAR